MSVLQQLVSAIKSASVEIIDLTAPLESTTPVIQLPEPFANTRSFTLTEVSRYDERGPAWYWNDISTGEHTGTHFDAPGALDLRPGRAGRLPGPGGQPDRARRWSWTSARRRRPTRTSCWSPRTSSSGRPTTARCPRAAGCCTGPAGMPAPPASGTSSTPTRTARTRPASPWRARAGWRRRRPSSASASRRSAPTPGAAHSFDPPFPCHSALLGAGKYGLTQLQNLALLPPAGAVLVAGPLPIVGGSGSPARVLALVERS